MILIILSEKGHPELLPVNGGAMVENKDILQPISVDITDQQILDRTVDEQLIAAEEIRIRPP
jgi:hypothetical protein